MKQVFLAALEQPADARDAFLAFECAGEPDIEHEVKFLLGAHDGAGSFLKSPYFADRSTIGAGCAVLPAEPSLGPGTRLGPYEIAAAIGRGGMGEVYRARDLRLGRHVAIKVLPRSLATDTARLARFELEARAASALNHPSIVAVHDIGWHDGVPFIVTELLEGETLHHRLARGRLPLGEALEWARQIAGGLVAAHERGIVHRDLKPANLFLTVRGQLKILDFGVAKLLRAGDEMRGITATSIPNTLPGFVLGTAGYMSPEQVRAEPVDVRSDQFSLGCVLYELVAGHAPFRRPTPAMTMAAVIQDEPPPIADLDARVPLPVVRVVERCLAKDPTRRYGSTRDLARDLERAVSPPPRLGACGSLRRRRGSAGGPGISRVRPRGDIVCGLRLSYGGGGAVDARSQSPASPARPARRHAAALKPIIRVALLSRPVGLVPRSGRCHAPPGRVS